jgi:WASH complex subunit 7
MLCFLRAQVISTLVKNFSEGNDFFRVLLRVFQEVLLSSPHHKHLDNFFMIVPALCVAFVDDSILGKVGPTPHVVVTLALH